MTLTGFYQFVNENKETKTYRNVKFESTGIKTIYGKVIWRKLKKDGTPTNIFTEQFEPNMPWAFGKWFCKIDNGTVLKEHPELLVENEKSKEMGFEEYCKYLTDKYYG